MNKMKKIDTQYKEETNVREFALELIDHTLQVLLFSLSFIAIVYGIYWMYIGHPYQSKIIDIWNIVYFHFIGDTVAISCFMFVLFCGYKCYISIETLLGLFLMIGVFLLASHVYFHLPYGFYP